MKKSQDIVLDEATLLECLRDPPEIAAAKAADIVAATKRQDALVAHQIAMERERFEFEKQGRMDVLRREAERDAELKELREFKRAREE